MLKELLESILLTESVSIDDVNDAMNNHKRIIINYHTKGEDNNTGARIIEIYAYGLTKAGNPVIRAFQPFGDTTTRVPSWKFFRLDRISAWKETNQKFTEPASNIYKGLGDFNPNGDETMSVVYKITSFNDDIPDVNANTNPKTVDNIFRTDTEKLLQRQRQMLDNPINLSDIKTKDAFKSFKTEPNADSGPKIQDKGKKEEPKANVYKTDTERGLDSLRQQLANPRKIDLTQFDKRGRRVKPKNKEQSELDTLRKQLGDTSKPIKMGDLKNKLSKPTQDQSTAINAQTVKKQEPELYKTDSERKMADLQKQLANPRKIDLSKMPRR